MTKTKSRILTALALTTALTAPVLIAPMFTAPAAVAAAPTLSGVQDFSDLAAKVTPSVVNGVRCMAYIRGAAGMRHAERKHPQDGRWFFKRPGGHMVDLRLSSMPTLYGESMAMRILHRDTHLTKLENLGFVGSQLGAVESLLHSPGGLILVTGPTGSGKTTTLYASLAALNTLREICPR